MIVNVCPSPSQFDETFNTLAFASKFAKINFFKSPPRIADNEILTLEDANTKLH